MKSILEGKNLEKLDSKENFLEPRNNFKTLLLKKTDIAKWIVGVRYPI